MVRKFIYPSKQYPKECAAFKGLHDRVKFRRTTTTCWSQDRKGFDEFFVEIGPIPKGMIRPTVGRKDHSKGYIPNNVFWQEFLDNCRHIDPVSIKKISIANIGNKHRLGKRHTKKSIKIMSEAAILSHKNPSKARLAGYKKGGEKHWGTKHSEEHKKKQSLGIKKAIQAIKRAGGKWNMNRKSYLGNTNSKL